MAVTVALPVHACPARARTRTSALPSTVAWSGALLLVVLAPFEALEPVLRLPSQSVSDVELAIVIAGGAWGLSLLAARDRGWWRTPQSLPWALLLAAMGASAMLAPAWRTNALHMTARLGVAGGIFLMTAAGATTFRRRRAVVEVAAMVGVVVAAAAILEFLHVRAIEPALRIFRIDTAVVGEQVRASGTLQYPTIASMYLEITFAFALGLLAAACDERRVAAAAAWGLAALVMAEAIVVTFTRAGLITMAASLALVAIVRVRRLGTSDAAFRAVAVVALIACLEVVATHAPATTRLRMTTEGQEAWYRADIAAPRELAMATDATAVVPVRVTNAGRVAWDSRGEPPIVFSYHWVMENDDRVVAYEGLRTPFVDVVAPGSSVAVAARVRAPQRPGRYRLLWDIAEEGRLWFTTEPGGALVFSTVTVSGPAASAADVGPLRMLPRPTNRPGRLVLWRAAARMLAAHPLLGVGPDNYRLSYGGYAGVANADPRVHTNNMYLEIAVGAGLAGAAAFAWLLWTAGSSFRALLVGRGPEAVGIAPGIVAAGVAVLVHGCVDSFLGFTPTYVLMAVTLGVAVAGSRSAGESDAYRV